MWFGFWHISAMQVREISLINIENTKYCGGTHTKHNPYCTECYYLTQIQNSIRTRRNILNYRTAPLLAFYAGCIYYIYIICGIQSQQKWVWANAKSITLNVRHHVRSQSSWLHACSTMQQRQTSSNGSWQVLNA